MIVVPFDTGFTSPVSLTVATLVLVLLHVPPKVTVDNCDVLLPHTAAIPVIGATGSGDGLTVTVTLCVVKQPLTDSTYTYTTLTGDKVVLISTSLILPVCDVVTAALLMPATAARVQVNVVPVTVLTGA